MLPLITFVLAVSPIGPLPVTGLVPVPVRENLCSLHYRVSTSSPDCQAHCDQALGYFYSYVWIEAARSFETAIYYDPDCAFAWLGLSRALDEWKKAPTPKADPLMALTGGAIHPTLSDRLTKSPRDYALEMAKKLLPKASHRESLLINAKIQERSQPAADAKKKAIAVLDELLTLYDDDEEGWFARAKLAEGPNAAVPFYRSLLKLNPLHPGANHELVHFFEGSKRPALGWPYALKYIESSPGIPHALHMQAHLATRIGKWQETSDRSWKAIELERAYHAANNVKPPEDHQ